MQAASGMMEVPVEVIVKYSEKGNCRPVKVIYADEVFVVDRVLDEQPPHPARAYGYQPRVFTCLIAGHKRDLLFYARDSRWCVRKFVTYRREMD